MRRMMFVALVTLIACTASKPTVTPSSPSSLSPSSVPTVSKIPSLAGDWLQYGGNAARAGVSPDQAALGRVHQTWSSSAFDGAVYAQPLVSGAHVIVATEGDSVYSLAAASGRIEWRASLGAPVPLHSLPCGNIDPSGITGTPLIDHGVVYVVAFVRAGTHHELYALDLATGATRWHRAIDPPGLEARVEQERGALALVNGRVYVPFGGLYGDCGPYKGALVSVPAGGKGSMDSFIVPTQREAGIWNPAGPVSDGAQIWVTTGNSQSHAGFDYGNAVIKLSPALKALDYFAPADWASLNASDTDLGSLGPALVTAGRVLAAGKAGVAYLLNSSKLGNIGRALDSMHICDGAFGAAATKAGVAFVPCRDSLVAVRVTGDALHVVWKLRGGSGPPIIAGNVVWSIGYGGELRGVAPATGAPVFHAQIGDPVSRFASPSAANGRLVVPSGNTVRAFVLR